MFRTLTLCALVSLGCALAQDSRPTSKPAEAKPEKTLMERLSEQQLGVDFGETTLPDVAEFLYELAKLNVVLSPSCPTDAKVTLVFKGVSMKNALDQIAAAFEPKLEWSVHANSIVHLRKAGAPALKTPKLDPDHAETRKLRASARHEAADAELETARCCGDVNAACELLFPDDALA